MIKKTFQKISSFLEKWGEKIMVDNSVEYENVENLNIFQAIIYFFLLISPFFIKLFGGLILIFSIAAFFVGQYDKSLGAFLITIASFILALIIQKLRGFLFKNNTDDI
jgi:hypothetical protein